MEPGKDSPWQKTNFANLIRYLPSGTYYARLRVNGKLKVKSLQVTSVTMAKLKLGDLEKELRGTSGLVGKRQGKGETFGEILRLVKENGYRPLQPRTPKDEIHLKPRSLAYYDERAIALFKSWPELETTPLLSHAQTEWQALFDDWRVRVRTRSGREWSGSSFNHTVTLIRWVLAAAINRGLLYKLPILVRKREVAKKPTLPTPEQFEALLHKIETITVNGKEVTGPGKLTHCANLVRFLAYGGFRVKSEARWVTWADCDFKRAEIVVRGDPVTGTKGTDSLIRRVPMVAEMRQLLLKLRDRQLRKLEGDESALDPLPVMQVFECQKALDRGCKRAGIPRLTHHDLRDVFATQCIEAGVPIPTIAKWLGHKDGGALLMRTYAHLRDTHSTEMAKRVSFSATKPANIVQLEMAV